MPPPRSPQPTPTTQTCWKRFTIAEPSPRAAFAGSAGGPQENGKLMTTAITAPVDGILIINASVEMFRFDTVDDHLSCRVEIDETSVSGWFMRVQVGGTQENICSTGGAAIVTTGVHNVDLVIAHHRLAPGRKKRRVPGL